MKQEIKNGCGYIFAKFIINLIGVILVFLLMFLLMFFDVLEL